MDFGNTVWEYNFPGITATKSDCPVFQVLWGWRQQIEYWALYEPFHGFPDDSAGTPEMQETQEMMAQYPDWEDPLEEEMAIHSSILIWKIPWMEEPGGLQSMGSQRVRHY